MELPVDRSLSNYEMSVLYSWASKNNHILMPNNIDQILVKYNKSLITPNNTPVLVAKQPK